MGFWIVIEYEQIDVRLYTGHKKLIPADPDAASLVLADSADDAIRRAAMQPGFYAAIPIPDDLHPTRYALVEEAA